MQRKIALLPLLSLLLTLPALADVQKESPGGRLPEGSGLATEYPGDQGIAKDPNVLFHEDFERDSLDAWGEKKGPVSITTAAPYSGARCLEIPMHRGKDTGGHLIKWLSQGADTVYVRFYVKFSKDYQYDHHFVTLLANPPEDRWRAFGKAGLKPDGSYFGSGMEPWFAWGKNPPPGEINLYAYYPDMEIDPKMNKYWGNAFFPTGPGKGEAAGSKRVVPPLDRWQCWEFMLQANTVPDKADGKQAMWVDGKLVGEFPGLRWRTRNDVKVNCLWIQHYGYDDSDPTRQYSKDQQTVWFDDIVVSTRYVGPRLSASKR